MQIEKSREVHLVRRPEGLPAREDFKLVTVPLASIGQNEVLVKNLWMSVDPYMRGRMTERKSYIEPFALNTALEGGAIGEVIASNNPQFAPGSKVSSHCGWREYFISDGAGLQLLPQTGIADQAFLGILGMPGMTAYTGLKTIARLKAADRVFVSAAAGAVGAVACQIAKLSGCYVAGSVGSEEKAHYLRRELGVDAVVNYKTCTDLQAAIADACPGGIDVYYENVGGAHLEACLNLMNSAGRIAVCGLIDQYNATAPAPGPRNLVQLLVKSLTMQGFIVADHWDAYPHYVQTMSQWIEAGKVRWKETVFEGIERAPEAFLGLFTGVNLGKMLVKLA